MRDREKYDRMLQFAEVLPRIRRRTARDLKRPGLPREKVLATLVRLLEKTSMRVGNDEYTRENGSFGLTTLRDDHAQIDGSKVRFAFRGKGGIRFIAELRDDRLARTVKSCRDLPGDELFQYIDEDGTPQSIDSADVNAYLRDIAGNNVTAKDFRTWAGTMLAAKALATVPPAGSATRRSDECWRLSTGWRNIWATRRRCAGKATSIQPFSTPTWRDRQSTPTIRPSWRCAAARLTSRQADRVPSDQS
jgi:DNA topoisomerase I